MSIALLTDHRPDLWWMCSRCKGRPPQPWPCPLAQDSLVETFTGDWAGLKGVLYYFLADASLQLPLALAGDLRAQIVGWAEVREAEERASRSTVYGQPVQDQSAYGGRHGH